MAPHDLHGTMLDGNSATSLSAKPFCMKVWQRVFMSLYVTVWWFGLSERLVSESSPLPSLLFHFPSASRDLLHRQICFILFSVLNPLIQTLFYTLISKFLDLPAVLFWIFVHFFIWVLTWSNVYGVFLWEVVSDSINRIWVEDVLES